MRELGCMKRKIGNQNLPEHRTSISKNHYPRYAVRFESHSKVVLESSEVKHVTTKLIRLY